MPGYSNYQPWVGNLPSAIRLIVNSVMALIFFWHPRMRANILCNEGQVALELPNKDLARAKFERAIKLFPQHWQSYYNLGLFFIRKNLHQKAVDCFSKSLLIKPDFGWAYNERCRALLELERFQDARKDAETLAVLEPNNEWADSYLAQVHSFFGNYDTAIACYESAIRKNPANLAIRCDLANLRFNQGKSEEAERELRQIIDEDHRNSRGLNSLGVILRKQGKLEAAQELFRRAVLSDSSNASAIANLGEAYMEQGHLELGIMELLNALRIDTSLFEARFTLGHAYRRMEDFGKAIETMKTALALRPDDARVSYNLACYYCLKGELQNALAALENALGIDASLKNLARTDNDFGKLRSNKKFNNLISVSECL